MSDVIGLLATIVMLALPTILMLIAIFHAGASLGRFVMDVLQANRNGTIDVKP